MAQGRALAINQYHQALEIEHEFPEARVNLGVALAEEGNVEEAKKELLLAEQMDPSDPFVRFEIACCYIDLKCYPQAIGLLKRMIKEEPHHPEAYLELGNAYTAQGFYAEAENALHKALAMDAENFIVHYYLAALFAAWGRVDEAFSELNIANTIDPERFRNWLFDDETFSSLKTDSRFSPWL